MAANFDERLAEAKANLEKVSKKAADVYGDAKAAVELGQEVVEDKIKDVKGDLVAAQERLRIADENSKNYLASQAIKVQMTLRAKAEDIKNAYDKKKLEDYIDARINHLADLYDTISYLLSDADLTALEAATAITEYSERFPDKAEE